MTSKMYAAFVASLSLIALSLPTDATFARSAGAPGGARAAPHSVVRSLPHHRGHRIGGVWPTTGGLFYAPNGEPIVDVTPPASGEVHYRYTYDVPWDWAHRYPPNVVPSDRAYVTECPSQAVIVPGAGGREHTVNVMRCY